MWVHKRISWWLDTLIFINCYCWLLFVSGRWIELFDSLRITCFNQITCCAKEHSFEKHLRSFFDHPFIVLIKWDIFPLSSVIQLLRIKRRHSFILLIHHLIWKHTHFEKLFVLFGLLAFKKSLNAVFLLEYIYIWQHHKDTCTVFTFWMTIGEFLYSHRPMSFLFHWVADFINFIFDFFISKREATSYIVCALSWFLWFWCFLGLS